MTKMAGVPKIVMMVMVIVIVAINRVLATEVTQVRVVAHNEHVHISLVISINFPNMTHEQHVGLQQIYEQLGRAHFIELSLFVKGRFIDVTD
ncbi:hypothetical protein V1522DRAFT_415898 [Lipomyces starkeyi]